MESSSSLFSLSSSYLHLAALLWSHPSFILEHLLILLSAVIADGRRPIAAAMTSYQIEGRWRRREFLFSISLLVLLLIPLILSVFPLLFLSTILELPLIPMEQQIQYQRNIKSIFQTLHRN